MSLSAFRFCVFLHSVVDATHARFSVCMCAHVHVHVHCNLVSCSCKGIQYMIFCRISDILYTTACLYPSFDPFKMLETNDGNGNGGSSSSISSISNGGNIKTPLDNGLNFVVINVTR